MDPVNLDEFRSVDELVNYQKDVRGRLSDLNTEFDGLPFPDEARDEFAGLKSTNEEIDRRVRELKARQQVVADMGQEPLRVERFDDRSFGRTTAKQADIYDLDDPAYRDAFNNPDRLRGLYRDNALRATAGPPLPPRAITREDIQTGSSRCSTGRSRPHRRSSPGICSRPAARSTGGRSGRPRWPVARTASPVRSSVPSRWGQPRAARRSRSPSTRP